MVSARTTALKCLQLWPFKTCLFWSYFQFIIFKQDRPALFKKKTRPVCSPSTCLISQLLSPVQETHPMRNSLPNQMYCLVCFSQASLLNLPQTTCLLPSAQAKSFQGHTFTIMRHLAQDERKPMFPFICTTSSFVTCIMPNLAIFLPMKGH